MDDGQRKRVSITNRLSCRLVASILLFWTFTLHAKGKAKSIERPVKERPKEVIPGQEPSVVAESAAAIDSFSGDFLFLKNEDARQYPASATKILTALLVIEAGNLDQLVTVDESDTKVEPTILDLKPGEQYTRRQLLFGMMLKSANDVARALSRDNAGSVEAFAEKMTLRAAELGATNSHFMNPNGLHDLNHYTTAHDLALIARAAMQQPLFREIVSTVYFTWNSPKGAVYQLRNHNRLLRHFIGCNGVKTGYTRAAQQVLVSSALRDGHEAISVVLHTDKPGIWEDSKALLTYGLVKEGCSPELFGAKSEKSSDKGDEPGEGAEQ
jgi:serine-type D-Ala-D-Ala carboxypeptidase (penicillin-binding protein 5/6)